MVSRSTLHEEFTARFHAQKRPKPFTAEQLEGIESALGVLLPSSYREFGLAHGAVYTPALLDLVVERKPGFSSVQEFFKPAQTLTETRRWRKLGLPDDCFAFASDSSGSLFAFRNLPSREPRPADAAVWLFDHEEGETREEAASFDEWLARFLKL